MHSFVKHYRSVEMHVSKALSGPVHTGTQYPDLDFPSWSTRTFYSIPGPLTSSQYSSLSSPYQSVSWQLITLGWTLASLFSRGLLSLSSGDLQEWIWRAEAAEAEILWLLVISKVKFQFPLDEHSQPWNSVPDVCSARLLLQMTEVLSLESWCQTWQSSSWVTEDSF